MLIIFSIIPCFSSLSHGQLQNAQSWPATVEVEPPDEFFEDWLPFVRSFRWSEVKTARLPKRVKMSVDARQQHHHRYMVTPVLAARARLDILACCGLQLNTYALTNSPLISLFALSSVNMIKQFCVTMRAIEISIPRSLMVKVVAATALPGRKELTRRGGPTGA